MKNISKHEFDALASTLTSEHGIRNNEDFGVTIGVRLPYKKIASRVVATAPTLAEARALAKSIKAEHSDVLDIVCQVYMPELAVAKATRYHLPKLV